MLFKSLVPSALICVLAAFTLRPTSSTAQDVHIHVIQTTKQAAVSAVPAEFPTIQMALDHAPAPPSNGRLIIHIAPGIYRERVWVSPERTRTTFLGEGADASQVVIVAGQSAKTAGGTFLSATTNISAADFHADRITFANDAGPVGQAVAIAVNADRAIFKHCRFLGDQDTLLANFGRQLYVDSYIEGGVDFIFGNATALFEHDEIHIIRPGYLTAQSRTSPALTTGYVFDHSTVTAADMGEKHFYLGRPWRAYSRVVFMNTELPASLNSDGWATWMSNTPDLTTPFYAEFANSGPGANTVQRVSWSHQLTSQEAEAFAPAKFLRGDDHWDALHEAASLP